jgi:hypothetical protein
MARIYTPTQVLTTSPVGQLRLIQNAFTDLKGGTVKEITEHVVKGGLVTKQDPTRVVMFYMIHLSKLGKVKEITETELVTLRGNGKDKLTEIVTDRKGKKWAKFSTDPVRGGEYTGPMTKKTATKKTTSKTTSR